MVRYIYDAWGNHAVVDVNGGDITTGIGALNPFRYRGYYYDTETELYFLQTRYYDPEVGRFISQDSIDYADPKTINGLNLYAYCGDNPVMRADYAGTSWSSFWSSVGRFLTGLALIAVGTVITISTIIPALISPVATGICEFGLTTGFYGVALFGSVFNSTIYSDMELIGWNPFNNNAENAAKSSQISFYKGVPIMRTNGRAGSFGIILIDDNDAETVKHESGHIMQLMLLGIARYGLCIGIPSWKQWGVDELWTYYKSPWDAGAELFGGSRYDGALTNTEISRAIKYLVYSYFCGPLVYAFYKYI